MKPLNDALDPQVRSRAVFPGASLGEYNLPPELATVLVSGEGCHVIDMEGKEYIDMTMGWGSLILGHAFPAVVKAVQARVADASNFAYVSEPALLLAEELVRCIRCAEKVRFCASGTEATMYLARLARAFTHRDKIIKFEGAYHGANDTGVMSLFPDKLHPFPKAEAGSAGVHRSAIEDTLIAPYNDLDATRAILAEHKEAVAAIIVEPLHRCTTPQPGFLAGLRELATEYGALLLFDEVVTGFRLAYGGAQEYYDVVPDLAAFGKGLGGGYPIGAIVGRADIMDLVDEARHGEPDYVWFASSVGGNPVSTTAALATLAELRKPGTYEALFASGETVREELRRVLKDASFTAEVLGDGPLCAVAFTSTPITDYRTAKRADSSLAKAFTYGLFERGVFLNPMSTKFYLSLAHQDAEVNRFIDIAKSVLANL